LKVDKDKGRFIKSADIDAGVVIRQLLIGILFLIISKKASQQEMLQGLK